MAQEFNIPGLKESINDISKLQEEVAKLSKLLLDTAINGEKSMASFKNTDSINKFVEAKRQYTRATDDSSKANVMLEAAEKRLEFAKSELGKKIADVNLQIQKQNALNRSSVDVVDKATESLKNEVATITEARAQNALLTQARNNVNVSTAEGQAQLKIFNDAIDKNNEFIKSNADATLKQKMNIGNYSEAIQDALGKTGLFNGKLGEVSRTAIGFIQSGAQAVQKVKEINDSVVTGAKNISGYVSAKLGMTKAEELNTIAVEENAVASASAKAATIGFQTAERATTAATTANTITTEANAEAKLGLGVASETAAAGEAVATGATWGLNAALGVLLSPITIVIAAIAALAYIFKDFAPLINPVKDAFSALMAVFGTIKQSIFDLVTGARSLTEIFSNFGSSAREAAAGAMELAKAQREVAKAQDANEVANARAQTQVQQLILQSKNRTLSEQERIDLINKAQKIEEEAFRKTDELNNRAIENARKKLFEGKYISDEERKFIEANDYAKIRSLKIAKNLDDEDLKAYKELLLKKEELAQRDNQIQEKAQNREDQLADRKQANAEKAAEKAKKDRETAEKHAEEAAKKAIEHEKKQAEEAIKTMKITLDYQIESYDKSEHLEEENLAHVEAISKMKSAIATAEMNKNLIGVQKGSDEEISIRNANKQELQKIELEKQKAILSVQQDAKKIELELYDTQTSEIMNSEKTLTDRIIDEQKKRLKESLRLHKDAMREELKIDKDTTDEKLKMYASTGAKLTANEQKYLKFILDEEKKTASAEKKIDSDVLSAKMKTIEDEEKAESRKFRLSNKNSFDQAVNESKLIDKSLKEKKKLLLEEQKNLKQENKDYAANAKQIKDIDDAIADNKQKLNEIVTKSRLEGAQASLSMLIEFSGKESAVGKAAAIAQATIDTYVGATRALKDYPAPYSGIVAGLTIAMGLKNVTEIAGIQAFEVGTDSAPYTGLAIVDEAGAEIHTDKFGNIKSFGSDSGAHLTNITAGDKIIPADISSLIMQSLSLNFRDKNQIDYDKIGEQFGKHAGKIVSAISNKKEASLSVIVQKNISDRVMFKGKNT